MFASVSQVLFKKKDTTKAAQNKNRSFDTMLVRAFARCIIFTTLSNTSAGFIRQTRETLIINLQNKDEYEPWTDLHVDDNDVRFESICGYADR